MEPIDPLDIVLYVPGMPFNGETLPRGFSLGGSETAGVELARELAGRGHRVTVFSAIAAAQAGCWEGVTYRPIGPPSPAAPFGEAFEAHAAAVPCDVLIAQRVPGVFHRPTAAKVHLWWSHDLALRRSLPAFSRQLWNLNAVLCVSEFHKAQLGRVYGVPAERIAVVPNGVDPARFPALGGGGTGGSDGTGGGSGAVAKRRGKLLLYSSRPERGLEHLLGGPELPGILEHLAVADPDIRLQVCGYDNTAPELAAYYAHLRARCRALPNAEWLGALSKDALAHRMDAAWLHVYPTTFEETSCITAMEAQSAGTPVVTSPVGALPETLRGGGVVWVPFVGDSGDNAAGEHPSGRSGEGAGSGGTGSTGGASGTGRAGNRVDREAYASAILKLRDDPAHYDRLHARALAKARDYGWEYAAQAVEALAAECLAAQSASPGRLARHLLRHSDIAALRTHLAAQRAVLTQPYSQDSSTEPDPLLERARAELVECYAFAMPDTAEGAGPADSAGCADPADEAQRLARHYEGYYAYEAARGVVYGPEELTGQPRFEAVARQLAALPPGARVLDYGCAHGHYTMNLGRRFPHLRFLGIDLVQRNIAAARAWAAAEGLRAGVDGLPPGVDACDLPNPAEATEGAEATEECAEAAGQVLFRVGTAEGPGAALRPDERFALILAAEVLEHAPRPGVLADALAAHLEPGGRMVITTPYGPWEAQGYREHHPWRAHLHHFERADLAALFGHHPGFACEPVPAGQSAWGEPLGSWLTTFRAPDGHDARPAPSGTLDQGARLRRMRPRETLSVCMVVGPQGETLARSLASVAEIADEVVLGIDAGPHADRKRSTTGGRAWELAEAHGAHAFALASPLATGFAEARNATLARAHGDWVLWIDDDEELLWPERLPKYLRDNLYDAYAVAQHHFAVEPGGVIKTDYPCRLFRRARGFAFYGVVHEHPERGLNAGAGAVLLLPDLAICHNGYVTEAVRRERFARNRPLMQRDRAAHPERVLGRFLWLRDLAHLNRFEHEQSGAVSPAMRARATEAIDLWRGLLAEGHVRLAVDALPYYSEAARLLCAGGAAPPIDFHAALALHRLGLGDPDAPPAPIQGAFAEAGDIEALTTALLKEKLGAVTGEYV